MTLDNMIAQFFGFFYGLSFSILVFIYIKLRERMARLEWRLDAGEEKPKKKDKSKKPKGPKEA